MEILAFEVEGERYGLPMENVREVTRAVSPTPLPGGPDLVEGLVNVRGTMNVLLDVRRRFGHPGRPIHPDDHFVLARASSPAPIRSVAADDLVGQNAWVLLPSPRREGRDTKTSNARNSPSNQGVLPTRRAGNDRSPQSASRAPMARRTGPSAGCH